MRFTGWNPASPQYKTLKTKMFKAVEQLFDKLKEMASEDGMIQFQAKDIAPGLGITVDTANKYIGILRDKGLIETWVINNHANPMRIVRIKEQNGR